MPSPTDIEAIEARAREPMAFFPHDSNASSDIKCRKLVRRFGVEGYGRWWLLCELLAATSGHALPAGTEEDVYVIAEALRFQTSAFDDVRAVSDCRVFLDALVEIGLVCVTDEGEVYSPRMMRNGEYFGRQRHNGSKGGRPRKRKEVSDV